MDKTQQAERLLPVIPEEDQADTIYADGDIDDGPGVTDAGTWTASTNPQAKWMAALNNRRATVAPCDIAEQGENETWKQFQTRVELDPFNQNCRRRTANLENP